MNNRCFPGAPDAWGAHPVSDLATVNPRYPVRKGDEYPFVEMAMVGENFGGILGFETRRFDASGLAKFAAGDTLFAKITPCAENGKVAYVDRLPGEIGIGSTEFIVLAPRADSDPRFLYHLLCSQQVRGRAASRMEGSTGRQRVPDDVFEKRLLVPVPSPAEQAAIARLLDAVDAAIARTRAAAERTRELQDSLLADAFERLDAPRRRLGEFTTDVRYGTSQMASSRGWGLPVLRIPNVVGDQLTLDDLAFVELRPADIARLTLEDGDLLFVRTNGNPNYVGRSAVFRAPDARTWLYASYLIRVRLNESLLPDFANVFLGTQWGRRELLRRVTTSAGNHNINGNSIRLLSIPVPADTNDQAHVVRIAHACRAKTAALRAKLTALAALKRSLMHDLLTGRVRVGV